MTDPELEDLRARFASVGDPPTLSVVRDLRSLSAVLRLRADTMRAIGRDDEASKLEAGAMVVDEHADRGPQPPESQS